MCGVSNIFSKLCAFFVKTKMSKNKTEGTSIVSHVTKPRNVENRTKIFFDKVFYWRNVSKKRKKKRNPSVKIGLFSKKFLFRSLLNTCEIREKMQCKKKINTNKIKEEKQSMKSVQNDSKSFCILQPNSIEMI